MRKRFEKWWQEYQGKPFGAHLGEAAKVLAWKAFKAASIITLALTFACTSKAQTTYTSTTASSNNVGVAVFSNFVDDPTPGVQVQIRCGAFGHVWWYYTGVGTLNYHAYGPFVLNCTVNYSINSQGEEVAQVTVPAQSPQQAGDASVTLEPSSFTTTQGRYRSFVTGASASIAVQ